MNNKKIHSNILHIMKQIAICFIVFFVIFITISGVSVKAEEPNDFNINVIYKNGESQVLVTSKYKVSQKSALLADYNDKEGGDFYGWTPTALIDDIYEQAFAGWKLVSINGNPISGEYYYPDNDFIYSNDIPFNNETFTDDTVIVFEPFFGKRIYLRDKYNFVDLSNLYGENVETAKIDWDGDEADEIEEGKNKVYAYSIKEANSSTTDDIENVGSRSDNPVDNMNDAFIILGTTGGEIVTVNHYTFKAPDNYYPYHPSYDNKLSTYTFNLGTNIQKGVVTFTGEGYGKDVKNTNGSESEKSNDKTNLSDDSFNSYYANSYWYYINFRGNTAALNKSLTIYTYFRCDTVIEDVNVVGMREIYLLEGGRNNNDLYWYGCSNKRWVLMESVDYYKRNTGSGSNSYSATNWSHSTNSSGYSALAKGAKAYLQLYTGSYSKNDGTDNIYTTIYGEIDNSKYYDSFYHLRIVVKNMNNSTVANAKINNIHYYIDTIDTNNVYGIQQGLAKTFECNYYGLESKDCYVNTSFEPVSNTTSSYIKEFALDLLGTKSGNLLSSVYTGGYLNDNTGKTMVVNFDKVIVNVSENAKITDLYGGGNQIAVKINVSESLIININGGRITNVYGGSEGGDLNVLQKIKLNINAGVIDNVFGGGAGGLTELYLSNSPKNLKNYSHSDDYSIIYDANEFYYRACSLEIRKVNYNFGDEIKPYDILVYTNFYIQSPYDVTNLTNYYQTTMNVCLSNALVTTGQGIDITINGGTINKSVYGGGKNGAVASNIDIKLLGGTVKGDIFGGGLGKDTKFSTRAGVSGPSGVTSALANALGYEVYYTGNQDAWTSEKFVDFVKNNDTTYSRNANYMISVGQSQSYIDGYMKPTAVKADFIQYEMLSTDTNGTKYFEVYSDVVETLGKITGDTDISLNGSTVNGSVFGGSDGAVANITGTTNVDITAGTIKGNVYGGGNVAVVTNDSNVFVAGVKVPEIYGGGNIGSINGSTYVEINDGSEIDSVFAGCNQANVGESTNLVINGGKVGSSYGGNNQSGAINTSIKTIINNGEISNVYGGGDNAGTSLDTYVTINGGKITSLYGGGKNAEVKNTYIEVFEKTSIPLIIGNLYGGGFKGLVSGNTYIDLNSGTINSDLNDGVVYGNLFGGGFEGDVNGSTNITVNGGFISNSLYGGGYEGSVNGSTNITINNGTISSILSDGTNKGNLYGGGYEGEVKLDTNITVNDATIYGNLYGGGYAGTINEDTTIIIDNGTMENIYGGGYAGYILGNTKITINNGKINENVYGGGYKGNVEKTTIIDFYNASCQNIFGGGFEGDVENKTQIIVNSGEIKEDIFGGGYKGLVNESNLSFNGGTIKGNVYGGGYSNDVSSNVSIVVNDIAAQQNIYGGGYAGHVKGSTSIEFYKGTVLNNIYGGGFIGTANSTSIKLIEESDKYGTIKVHGCIFGGGYGLDATVYETTNVEVNLNLEQDVVEKSVDTDSLTESSSGESAVEVSFTLGYSFVDGSIYGGGDLGQIGEGLIDTSKNTATVTKSGRTKVVITNGYIGGSVFGGGSGIPKEGAYQLEMGTVYGSTQTIIFGGYIGKNVYGGGTQSRVYFSNLQDSSIELATEVIIEEKDDLPIVINGSVFGGGDRGNSATTNASVPTTVGDAKVTINGNASGSSIYFITGGVYGDGNLCLVNGTRTIELNNFTTGQDNLKTFRSLQRANLVKLNNSDIVLLGAVDLVEEGDNTVYSINRIGSLVLENGSTIKLDQIVKYLGQIESDYEFVSGDGTINRKFIDRGNNGTNGYVSAGETDPDPLTDNEIKSYQDGTGVSTIKNVICVANGLYLEIFNEENKYGKVLGLFTLQLLRANEGEGGGFVYASIEESTGSFICETKYGPDKAYMTIIGNVSGYNNSSYTYYCWFIQGNTINYSIEIEGYIGSDETAYKQSSLIPEHTKTLYYVLNSISVNSALANAIVDDKYTLVQKNTNLTDQEIALELFIGTESIGFLSYSAGGWYINGKQGYNSNADNLIADFDNYKLGEVAIGKSNNELSFVLHKSKGVNNEINNMQLELEIDLLLTDEDNLYKQYSDGTAKLKYKITFSIIRLVPEQNFYSGSDRMYSGLNESTTIKVTNGSSFTIEYQTRYIPIAFPKGTNQMFWILSTKGYSYYIDELGNYLTVDDEGNAINISPLLTLDSNETDKILVTKNAHGEYEYTHDNKLIKFKLITSFQSTYLPKGTKITMIDMSLASSPTYYYYLCEEDTVEINLNDFFIMGTNTTLSNSQNNPEFKNIYYNVNVDEEEAQKSARVTERLIFVFDLEEVSKDSYSNLVDTVYNGNVVLNHLYGQTAATGIDIMDFVKSDVNEDTKSYTRSTPKVVPYQVDIENTGVKTFEVEFKEATYSENEIAEINIEITQDVEYKNTQLKNGKIGVKIMVSGDDHLPDGIEFRYNGVFLPKYGNKYLIVPLLNYGEYTIEVVNNLGSIITNQALRKSMFEATLCYLPDKQYFNQTIIQNTEIVDFNIECNITDEVLVGFDVEIDNPYIEYGTTEFNVKVFENNTADNTNLKAYYVDSNGLTYTRYIYTTKTITGSNDGTVNEINIFKDAQPGIYLLVFTNGDKEDFVYIIVK